MKKLALLPILLIVAIAGIFASGQFAYASLVGSEITIVLDWWTVFGPQERTVIDPGDEFSVSTGNQGQLFAEVRADINDSMLTITHDINQDASEPGFENVINADWCWDLTDLVWIDESGVITDLELVSNTFVSGDITFSHTDNSIQVCQTRNDFVFGTGLLEQEVSFNLILRHGEEVVGGKFLPIETTSLLLANAQTFSWMIPVILSGIGIGLFVVSRKSE